VLDDTSGYRLDMVALLPTVHPESALSHVRQSVTGSGLLVKLGNILRYARASTTRARPSLRPVYRRSLVKYF
jgi:hypothetical protein